MGRQIDLENTPDDVDFFGWDNEFGKETKQLKIFPKHLSTN